MKTLIRLSYVCFLGLGLASSAFAQDAALVECTDGYKTAARLQVYSLTVSAGSTPSFGEAPFIHLECAAVLATFLSEGYEIALIDSDTGLPTYTLIRSQPTASVPLVSNEEIFFVGCTRWALPHLVFYASTSPTAPAIPVGEEALCADALATLMRAGFSLVQAQVGVGGYYQYMFHRGRRAPLIDARSLSSSPGTTIARLLCDFIWYGGFFVQFGESSAGGPVVSFGEDVDCGAEIARLLDLGFRILDVRVGVYAGTNHVTLVHDPGAAVTPAGRRPRGTRRPTEVAIALCGEGWGPFGEWFVVELSMSSQSIPTALYEPCQPVLDVLLSSGWELRHVSGYRFGRFSVFMLVTSETRGGRKRGK